MIPPHNQTCSGANTFPGNLRERKTSTIGVIIPPLLPSTTPLTSWGEIAATTFINHLTVAGCIANAHVIMLRSDLIILTSPLKSAKQV